MRTLLSAALALVIGIAFAGTAEAAPKKKFVKRAQHSHNAGYYQPRRPIYQPGYQYRAVLIRRRPGIGKFDPDSYRTGSTAWWRAMDYQGRGGFN